MYKTILCDMGKFNDNKGIYIQTSAHSTKGKYIYYLFLQLSTHLSLYLV